MMRPSVPSPTVRDGLPMSTPLTFSHQAFTGIHGDGARSIAEMLGDLERRRWPGSRGLERVEDRDQFAFELHVDDGTVTWVMCRSGWPFKSSLFFTAPRAGDDLDQPGDHRLAELRLYVSVCLRIIAGVAVALSMALITRRRNDAAFPAGP
jgi:hypothetical protein